MAPIFLAGIVSCTVGEDEGPPEQLRDGLPPGCPSDVLYVGDIGADVEDPSDDFIARFDANTGKFLGYLVPPGSNEIDAPMGILVDKNQHVLLVNQNFGTETSGDIRILKPHGIAPVDVLVAPTTEQGPPNTPWAPRGMVLGDNNIIYVADVGYALDTGRITLWNSKTGAYVGDLDFGDFDNPDNPDRVKAPRGIVIGPDGYIYVSNTNIDPTPVPEGAPPPAPTLGGSILRFDPETGEFVDVVYECTVAAASVGECNLNRPEGLVFGPDGRLYITSFRADATDVDRILVLDLEDGTIDTIDLYEVGEPRVFSMAILFGPDDALYVPITSPLDPNDCEVRKYEIVGEGEEWKWECFVKGADSPLVRPFYLTFGETNPSTLAYEPKKQCD